MAKPKFHWTDVALGAVVSLVVLLIFWMQWAEGLEGKLYDIRARLRAGAKTAENVVLVGIDDDSIRQIGRWPWPRSYMAEMVDQLADARAKVIGLDIFFSDAELNPGLVEVRKIKDEYASKVGGGGGGGGAVVKAGQELTAADLARATARATASAKSGAAQEFVGFLDSAEKRLDNDARLDDSLALAQNAVLPMYFTLGQPIGKVEIGRAHV